MRLNHNPTNAFVFPRIIRTVVPSGIWPVSSWSSFILGTVQCKAIPWFSFPTMHSIGQSVQPTVKFWLKTKLICFAWALDVANDGFSFVLYTFWTDTQGLLSEHWPLEIIHKGGDQKTRETDKKYKKAIIRTHSFSTNNNMSPYVRTRTQNSRFTLICYQEKSTVEGFSTSLWGQVFS